MSAATAAASQSHRFIDRFLWQSKLLSCWQLFLLLLFSVCFWLHSKHWFINDWNVKYTKQINIVNATQRIKRKLIATLQVRSAQYHIRWNRSIDWQMQCKSADEKKVCAHTKIERRLRALRMIDLSLKSHVQIELIAIVCFPFHLNSFYWLRSTFIVDGLRKWCEMAKCQLIYLSFLPPVLFWFVITRRGFSLVRSIHRFRNVCMCKVTYQRRRLRRIECNDNW